MISPTEISGLKIITILDNITQSAGPVAHWGVSTLIDYEVSGRNKRVLLDTGSDRECVLRNLKELKIDLRGMRASLFRKPPFKNLNIHHHNLIENK